jgi:hypothetical protein
MTKEQIEEEEVAKIIFTNLVVELLKHNVSVNHIFNTIENCDITKEELEEIKKKYYPIIQETINKNK